MDCHLIPVIIEALIQMGVLRLSKNLRKLMNKTHLKLKRIMLVSERGK
jgi:hypothetical protein